MVQHVDHRVLMHHPQLQNFWKTNLTFRCILYWFLLQIRTVDSAYFLVKFCNTFRAVKNTFCSLCSSVGWLLWRHIFRSSERRMSDASDISVGIVCEFLAWIQTVDTSMYIPFSSFSKMFQVVSVRTYFVVQVQQCGLAVMTLAHSLLCTPWPYRVCRPYYGGLY